MRERVEAIGAHLHRCSAVPDAHGAECVIDLFQEMGGQFLTLGDKPHPDPRSKIDGSGNLMVALNIEHEQLFPDAFTRNAILRKELPPDAKGRAGFSFLQSLKSVIVSQAIFSDEWPLVDQTAYGLLSFTLSLYPRLRPHYGWVDERGENLPGREDLKRDHPCYLYWANLFGPEFVRSVGADFFRDLPGWRLVNLDDGGVLYVATASYLEWWHTDEEDLEHLLAPFRAQWPEIEIYKSISPD
jgi:hypothetical protein